MTRSKKIWFSLFVLLVVFLVGLRWYQFFAGAEIKQPLAFNHLKHTEMAACEDCHGDLKKSASTRLPDIQVCTGCHKDGPVSDSPQEKILMQYIQSNQEIHWQRLYRNPVHVYFSHNRHVVVGKVECEKCHGEIAKMARPPGKPPVSLEMSRCVSCHEKNRVDNSCVTCHR